MLTPLSLIGEYAIGVKNVTINDNFFPGHFPDRPIMPGVLQGGCAAAAVCAACVLCYTLGPTSSGRYSHECSTDPQAGRYCIG